MWGGGVSGEDHPCGAGRANERRLFKRYMSELPTRSRHIHRASFKSWYGMEAEKGTEGLKNEQLRQLYKS